MDSLESWAAPAFAEPFQAVKFQQGNDAQFCARISGYPEPEVRLGLITRMSSFEVCKSKIVHIRASFVEHLLEK